MPHYFGGGVVIERHSLFTIYGYRGSVGDPEVVTKSLLKCHEEGDLKRKTSDPNSVCWQDIEIPVPFECSEIKKVYDYICNRTAEQLGQNLGAGKPWTICNGPLEQTYPHTHSGGCNWSTVYWAQVPENSGSLSLHPMGIEGPEIVVKPKEGDFLVFPSFLIHGVKHNASSEKRVSMSFNMIVGP
jgi:hypothetical protein